MDKIIIFILIFIFFKQLKLEKYKDRFIIKNTDKYWTNNIFNPNIAIVTQNTPEIKDYSFHSEINLKYYCNLHKYCLYIFKEHLCKEVHPCWYKIILIRKLLSKHKYLIWIDSDAIITNMNIKFESFILKDYHLFVCEDITPKRTPFNSGVMIFKNDKITFKYLEKVWNYEGIHGYTPNGDQDILNKYSLTNIKIKIYPMNYFNSHPLKFKMNDFILHIMFRNSKKRIQIMKQFNYFLKITNVHCDLDCIFNKKCLVNK